MSKVDPRPYLARARQELQAVEVNLREGLYTVAVSRSYYAMFYAASGLLASIGISRSKHSAIIAAFRQNFIKTNLIEAQYGDILRVGFESRQESDYELSTLIDRDLALNRWSEARRFVDRLEQYLLDVGAL